MSSFSSAFSYLQKIGKCMMLPVSVLPVAGILLGVGSANFSWLPQIVSQIMAQSGGAIFSNLPLLFAIGVAIGLTDNDGVAALASTVGFAVSVTWSATLEFAIYSGATKIHHLSTGEAFSSMQSAPSGLTSQEARRRLAEYRPNNIEKVPRQALLLTFSCQETKSLRQNPAGKSRPRH